MHTSTKILIAMLAIIFILPAPVFAGMDYPLIFSYNWHKVLHIFGAVIFLGNIIVTGLWMAWAERTKDATVLRLHPEQSTGQT